MDQPVLANLAGPTPGQPPWRIAPTLAHQGQRCRHLEADLSVNALAASIAALAAAPPPQCVSGHPEGIVGVQSLDRCVLSVGHPGLDSRLAVPVWAGPLASSHCLVVGELVVADEDVVHRSLGRRRNSVRGRLGESPEQDIRYSLACLDVARRHRRGSRRIHDRTLRRQQGKGPIAPTVGRNGRIGGDPHRVVETGAGHCLHGVEVGLHLKVRPGEVGSQRATVDGHLDPNGHIAGAMLHEVLELVGAVRQDLESGSHSTLAIVEQGLSNGVVLVETLRLHQFDQTSHRNRIGAHLSIEIPSPLPRCPGRRDERADEFLHPGSISNCDGRWNTMAFLINRHRMGRHRAWGLPSHVRMVRPIGHPGDVTSGSKHGSNDGEIVEVGASVERIVHGVLDPGLWIEAFDTGCNRLRHRAEMHRDVLGLGQHLSAGREDRR